MIKIANQDNKEEQGDSGMYTQPQVIALELIPLGTAPLSVLGSFSILWFLCCRRSRKEGLLRESTYHRLMMGISVSDLLSSLGFIVLGPWAVPSPEADDFSYFNRGNIASCEAAGFVGTLSYGAWWYSGFLSVYFVLLVRYEWKERTIARYVEPLAHAIGISYPIATGSFALVEDVFNPLRVLPGWCWYGDFPLYCSRADRNETCERGENYEFLRDFALYSVIVLLLTIVISMVLIVLKVWHTESQLRKYAVGVQQTEGSITAKLYRTRETAWQGLSYIGAFCASVIPFVIVKFIEENSWAPDTKSATLLPFALLTKFLGPLQVRASYQSNNARGANRTASLILHSFSQSLFSIQQGFFNACIYLRKRLYKLTGDGECFSLLRKVPLLCWWIENKMETTTTTNSSTQPRIDGSQPITHHLSRADVSDANEH